MTPTWPGEKELRGTCRIGREVRMFDRKKRALVHFWRLVVHWVSKFRSYSTAAKKIRHALHHGVKETYNT